MWKEESRMITWSGPEDTGMVELPYAEKTPAGKS